MTFILPERARVVRRISIAPASFLHAEVEEPWFPSRIKRAETSEMNLTAVDGPPRETNPAMRLQFAAPPITSEADTPQRPGERVETLGDVYELLGHRRKLRSGRREVGVEVAVMPVTTLYPFTGDLALADDTVVEEDVRFSMWGTTEIVGTRSGWEDSEGEAPIGHLDNFKANRILLVGGSRFHIMRAYVPPNVPRIRFVLRNKDIAG